MKIELFEKLSSLLRNGTDIQFELYGIEDDPEVLLLDIRGGNNSQIIDLNELQEQLIELVYELFEDNDLDYSESLGIKLEPKIDSKGELVIFFQSFIDVLSHEDLTEDFINPILEIKKLGIENLFDFLPEDFSVTNFYLSLDIIYQLSDITINEFKLIYFQKGQEIIIKNRLIKDKLLKKLEMAIVDTSYVLNFYPKYKNNLEIRVKIENNSTLMFKEYFNMKKTIYYNGEE
ncbi:hypothetical protein [Aquirufa aurantiipilula]|uniref:DUF2004 domain-containing protein n=1 Tax=Aquirufa aurantiipilula TaxID=2696561 RepID=A0ABT6BMK2_9BACT|nr:hypothetical protein [Aquirufa aurantiipilula]MDF5691594.1 hypothetical protein [Aquirufa aurantiipilula]